MGATPSKATLKPTPITAKKPLSAKKKFLIGFLIFFVLFIVVMVILNATGVIKTT